MLNPGIVLHFHLITPTFQIILFIKILCLHVCLDNNWARIGNFLIVLSIKDNNIGLILM